MSMPQLRITKQITKRENQSIEKYLQQVQAIPLLTVDEEIELARKVKKGFIALDRVKSARRKLKEAQKNNAKALIETSSKKLEKEVVLCEKAQKEAHIAKEKLIKGNLRFVISVAKQYQNRGLSINDLINEGNIGLMKAAERFDETRGFKFISYAVWWIRQNILQATQEKGRVIRIPLNRSSIIQKIYKTIKKLKKVLERHPTEEEVGEELDMDPETVISILETNTKPLSINAPFAQGEDNTLLDVIKNEDAARPEENLIDESIREEILRAVRTLDKREQEVIKEHFCIGSNDLIEKKFPKTLEDIARKMRLTRERVRQIREQAIKKIREYFMKNQVNSIYKLRNFVN